MENDKKKQGNGSADKCFKLYLELKGIYTKLQVLFKDTKKEFPLKVKNVAESLVYTAEQGLCEAATRENLEGQIKAGFSSCLDPVAEFLAKLTKVQHQLERIHQQANKKAGWLFGRQYKQALPYLNRLRRLAGRLELVLFDKADLKLEHVSTKMFQTFKQLADLDVDEKSNNENKRFLVEVQSLDKSSTQKSTREGRRFFLKSISAEEDFFQDCSTFCIDLDYSNVSKEKQRKLISSLLQKNNKLQTFLDCLKEGREAVEQELALDKSKTHKKLQELSIYDNLIGLCRLLKHKMGGELENIEKTNPDLLFEHKLTTLKADLDIDLPSDEVLNYRLGRYKCRGKASNVTLNNMIVLLKEYHFKVIIEALKQNDDSQQRKQNLKKVLMASGDLQKLLKGEEQKLTLFYYRTRFYRERMYTVNKGVAVDNKVVETLFHLEAVSRDMLTYLAKRNLSRVLVKPNKNSEIQEVPRPWQDIWRKMAVGYKNTYKYSEDYKGNFKAAVFKSDSPYRDENNQLKINKKLPSERTMLSLMKQGGDLYNDCKNMNITESWYKEELNELKDRIKAHKVNIMANVRDPQAYGSEEEWKVLHLLMHTFCQADLLQTTIENRLKEIKKHEKQGIRNLDVWKKIKPRRTFLPILFALVVSAVVTSWINTAIFPFLLLVGIGVFALSLSAAVFVFSWSLSREKVAARTGLRGLGIFLIALASAFNYVLIHGAILAGVMTLSLNAGVMALLGSVVGALASTGMLIIVPAAIVVGLLIAAYGIYRHLLSPLKVMMKKELAPLLGLVSKVLDPYEASSVLENNGFDYLKGRLIQKAKRLTRFLKLTVFTQADIDELVMLKEQWGEAKGKVKKSLLYKKKEPEEEQAYDYEYGEIEYKKENNTVVETAFIGSLEERSTCLQDKVDSTKVSYTL